MSLRTVSWVLLALVGGLVLLVSALSASLAYRGDFPIGGVPIGGGAPVAVQTVTKTETANLAATMERLGCRQLAKNIPQPPIGYQDRSAFIGIALRLIGHDLVTGGVESERGVLEAGFQVTLGRLGSRLQVAHGQTDSDGIFIVGGDLLGVGQQAG